MRNGLDQATTIHFHGIEQLDTPWSDGVAGLSQRPIEPGADWLYKWTATQYGVYWFVVTAAAADPPSKSLHADHVQVPCSLSVPNQRWTLWSHLHPPQKLAGSTVQLHDE